MIPLAFGAVFKAVAGDLAEAVSVGCYIFVDFEAAVLCFILAFLAILVSSPSLVLWSVFALLLWRLLVSMLVSMSVSNCRCRLGSVDVG